MAEAKININIDVNSAEQEIAKIRQDLQGVSNIDFDNISTLEDMLNKANDEAQKMAIVFGKNSQQFQDASKKVAQLTDEVELYNQTIDQNRGGAMMDQFVSGVQLGVSSMQVLQGAMTLFGSENEEVNQSIQKMMALLSLSQGIKSLVDLTKQMGIFRATSIATTAATNAQGIALKGQAVATVATTTATAGATTAVRGFSAALMSSGIGALVVLLGTLASAFISVGNEAETAGDKATNAIKDQIKALGDLDKKRKEVAKQNKSELDFLKQYSKDQDEINKQIGKGLTDNADIIKEQILATQEAIDVATDYMKNNARYSYSIFGSGERKEWKEANKLLEQSKSNLFLLDMQYKSASKTLKDFNQKIADNAKKNEEASKTAKDYTDIIERWSDAMVDLRLKSNETFLGIIEAFQFIEKSDSSKALTQQRKDWDAFMVTVLDHNRNLEKEIQRAIKEGASSSVVSSLRESMITDFSAFNTMITSSEKKVRDYFATSSESFRRSIMESNKIVGNALQESFKGIDESFKGQEDNLDSLYNHFQQLIDEAEKYIDTWQTGDLYVPTEDVLGDIENFILWQKGVSIEQKALNKLKEEQKKIQKELNDLMLKELSTQTLLASAENDITREQDNLQFGQGSYEKIQQVTDQFYSNQRTAIEAHYDFLEHQYRNDAAMLLQIENQKAVDLEKNMLDQNKAQKEILRARTNAQLDAFGEIGNAMSALGGLLGEETAAGKGLAIAGATIDTISGAIAAFMGYQSLGQPWGTIAGAAAAAAVTATGVANIKKIAEVEIPGVSDSKTAPAIDFTPPSFQNPLEANGVQDVRVLNDNNVIELKITDRELEESANRRSLNSSLNSF